MAINIEMLFPNVCTSGFLDFIAIFRYLRIVKTSGVSKYSYVNSLGKFNAVHTLINGLFCILNLLLSCDSMILSHRVHS